jgi:hypothetical protein
MRLDVRPVLVLWLGLCFLDFYGTPARCIDQLLLDLQLLQVTDDQHLDPDHVLAADVAQLRAAGLSERKVGD